MIVQRSHEIAVEPGQLGRDDRDPRLVPQRDAEQLAVIDTSAHELDAELTTLQAAHERRFPRRAAGARDHTDRDVRHGSSETSKRVRAAVRDSVRAHDVDLTVAHGERDEDHVIGCDRDGQRGQLAFSLPEQPVGVDDVDDLRAATRS